MHSPKDATNFTPSISYYKESPNPSYFNYGVKKSFIHNPTQQQEMLHKLGPSENSKESLMKQQPMQKKINRKRRNLSIL